MAMTADQLPDDPDVLKAMVLARDVENARLTQIIKELQRHRFGRRAESLPEDQLLLGLEEAEQIEAAGDEEAEHADPAKRRGRTAKRRANRGALPPHLPRIEMVVDIENHACPCCRNGLHRIGEDVSERLDIVPAGAARVKRMIYPAGFRWSKAMKPIVGTDRCMHAHVGFLARGEIHIEYGDGCVVEFKAPQVVAIDPGHDGWVVGKDPVVLIEFDFERETVSKLGMPAEHRH